jgi:tRNA (cmo5U34)-methyltransferase
MREDWTDAATAKSWDADPVGHNPLRVEQLDILLALLETEYRPGKAILDIGLGTGMVEELIFERVPGAYVVGVDFSEAMLEIAHRRLHPYRGQYEVVIRDIRDIDSLKLPPHQYKIAISVQTIHNVEDAYKKPIFDYIYRTLEPDGLFLLLDRIAVDASNLFSCYKALWDRLGRTNNTKMREGNTFEEHTSTVAARGDLPASLEQHLAWLRESGFEAACLHLHANRALFAARKPKGKSIALSPEHGNLISDF